MILTKSEYDEINEVESWLYNYKSIKASINNLKLESNAINECCIGSIDPGKETSSKTNKFNSDIENVITKKELLDSRVKSMEIKIEQLENALNSLSEIENNIIMHFYVEGERYYQFTHIVNVPERTCKRIKRAALNKIVIAMFGVIK